MSVQTLERPTQQPPLRVGLVLGGGGSVGVAYHGAVLTTLENDLGWDPRTAACIVGTSAGSLVGTFLRRGLTGTDLAALTVGAPAPDAPRLLVEAITARTPLPSLRLRSLLRLGFPSSPIVTEWLRHPWRVDPVFAVTALLPAGDLDLLAHFGQHADAVGDEWPPDDLWICAARQRDQHRVVFGQSARPSLVEAVAASCAIPGYFKPVVIDGTTYLDGGVCSPSNADVLCGCDLDLALIVSPMSGRDLGRFGASDAMRRYAKAKLRREVGRLEAAGIPTVVFEPDGAMAAVLGHNPMADDHLQDIVTAAIVDTGAQLRAPSAAAFRAVATRTDGLVA